jgi:hypothetical protein
MLVDRRTMEIVYKTPKHFRGTLLDIALLDTEIDAIKIACAYDDGHVIYDRKSGISATKTHSDPGIVHVYYRSPNNS